MFLQLFPEGLGGRLYLSTTLYIIESIPQLPELLCFRNLSFDLIFH